MSWRAMMVRMFFAHVSASVSMSVRADTNSERRSVNTSSHCSTCPYILAMSSTSAVSCSRLPSCSWSRALMRWSRSACDISWFFSSSMTSAYRFFQSSSHFVKSSPRTKVLTMSSNIVRWRFFLKSSAEAPMSVSVESHVSRRLSKYSFVASVVSSSDLTMPMSRRLSILWRVSSSVLL